MNNFWVNRTDVAYKHPKKAVCRFCKGRVAADRPYWVRYMKYRISALRYCSNKCYQADKERNRDGAEARVKAYLAKKAANGG